MSRSHHLALEYDCPAELQKFPFDRPEVGVGAKTWLPVGQTARDEKSDCRAGATVGCNHAPHLD
jgi:hypothetical protein